MSSPASHTTRTRRRDHTIVERFDPTRAFQDDQARRRGSSLASVASSCTNNDPILPLAKKSKFVASTSRRAERLQLYAAEARPSSEESPALSHRAEADASAEPRAFDMAMRSSSATSQSPRPIASTPNGAHAAHSIASAAGKGATGKLRQRSAPTAAAAVAAVSISVEVAREKSGKAAGSKRTTPTAASARTHASPSASSSSSAMVAAAAAAAVLPPLSSEARAAPGGDDDEEEELIFEPVCSPASVCSAFELLPCDDCESVPEPPWFTRGAAAGASSRASPYFSSSPSSSSSSRAAAASRSSLPSASFPHSSVLSLEPPSWGVGLATRWPGREDSVALLAQLHASPTTPAPPILMYGKPGCGKSTFVRDLVSTSNVVAACLSCVECPTPRALFEGVLHAVASSIVNWMHACVGGGRSHNDVLAALMTRLTSSGRNAGGNGSPTDGSCAAVSLARWSDTTSRGTGRARAAFVEAMASITRRRTSAAVAAAATSSSSSSSSFSASVRGLVAADVTAIVGERRCATLDVFLREMQDLCAFTVGDAIAVAAACGANVDRAAFCAGGAYAGMTESELVVHVVLDCAERLAAADPSLLQQLLQTPVKTGRGVCFLLVTDAPSAVFEAVAGGGVQPLTVPFPRPPPGVVRTLLETRHCPRDAPREFWAAFLQQVDLSIGQLVGHDYREMLYAANELFGVFRAPVTRGEASVEEVARLRKMAAPAFDAVRRKLLHRDAAQAQLEPVTPGVRGAAAAGAASRPSTSSSSSASTAAFSSAAAAATSSSSSAPSTPAKRERGIDLELPFYTKLLLIAAFCASFNPPETDRRYFMRTAAGGKKRKTAPTSASVAASRAHRLLSGPRAFTKERLLTLMHALLNSCEGSGSASSNRSGSKAPAVVYGDLFSQIAALQELHLLSRVSGVTELDVTKYRCNATMETVSKVAATLSIELGKFLDSA